MKLVKFEEFGFRVSHCNLIFTKSIGCVTALVEITDAIEAVKSSGNMNVNKTHLKIVIISQFLYQNCNFRLILYQNHQIFNKQHKFWHQSKASFT